MAAKPTTRVGFPPTLAAVAPKPVGMTRRGFLKVAAMSVAAATVPSFLSGCNTCLDNFDDTNMAGELYKVRPLTASITANAGTTVEKVQTVVQWVQKNFFHYYHDESDEDWLASLYRYDERKDGLSSISIETLFRERAVGCHYASGVVITMLRSIDIFAEYVQEDKGRFVDCGGHGVTHVPELDRYIHGDHVADLVATPAHELILTKSDLFYWSSHPGYPAEELGHDPSFGNINRGIYALYRPMNEKYGYTTAGLRLRRTGNSLYIFGFLSADTSEESFALLSSLCPEYGLELGEQNESGLMPLISQYVPIQELVW